MLRMVTLAPGGEVSLGGGGGELRGRLLAD